MMLIHNPNHWVGGMVRKKEWLLTAPISEDLLLLSIEEATFHSIKEYRMRLLKCSQVYDDWWDRLSEKH